MHNLSSSEILRFAQNDMMIKDFYFELKNRLDAAGIETSAIDARLLICHALLLTHEEFVLQNNRELSAQEIAAIDLLIAQRLQGRPVAKIIGQKEFYGRVFGTNDDTLDPRPDSEVLIEAVLASGNKGRVLDLGTGTGCLILTLLAEMPEATGVAVDRSAAALAVAQRNAERLNVTDRIEFLQSDWFSDVVGQFDVIVSNPPYIPDGEIPGLMPEVRLYDPPGALAGGADGLDPYRIIIPQLQRFLKKSGFVAFELGQGQAPMVAEMLETAGFVGVKAHRDLAGIERVVSGKRPE